MPIPTVSRRRFLGAAAGAAVLHPMAGPAQDALAITRKIKIGLVTDFSIPQLVNNQRVLEAVIEGTNKRGGWDVGGSIYTLELSDSPVVLA